MPKHLFQSLVSWCNRRHGDSVSIQRLGAGASKALDPSVSQKAVIVKLYSLGKTTHVTFCKLDIHTLFDWHSILAVSL